MINDTNKVNYGVSLAFNVTAGLSFCAIVALMVGVAMNNASVVEYGAYGSLASIFAMAFVGSLD